MLPGVQGIHPVIGASAASTGGGSLLFSGGALAYYTGGAVVGVYPFAAEEYDTDSIHDIVTNNVRMTIPSGASLVRVFGQETGTGSSSPGPFTQRNGVDFLGGGYAVTQDLAANVRTGPVAVTPGDYFTLAEGSLGTPDTGGGIWFGVEILDPATKYAVVSKTGNEALSAATPTILSWDSEVADTDGFHDNVTDNSRLTVPSGVSRVKLVCNLRSTSNVGTPYFVQIKKNGAVAAGCPVFGSAFTGRMNLSSAILGVAPGDYFEVEALTTDAQTVATGNHTWFAIYEVPDYVRTLVKKVATQSVTSGVAVAVAFGSGSEVYDTGGAHDESSNDSRLTVPSGYTKAKLSYSLVTASATGVARADIRMNGSGSPTPGLPSFDVNLTGVDYLSGEGAWIDVTPGDYFELVFTPGANQTLPIDDRTWFAIELQ
jgi:hypothetical protein